MNPITPKRELISDALAWIAFNALVLWLFSLLVGLSGYWPIYEQIAHFFELIKGCEGNHCSVQLSLNDPNTDPVWFGVNLSIVQTVRMPAFLTWLGIMIFQSFFVGRGRLKPWQPLTQTTRSEEP